MSGVARTEACFPSRSLAMASATRSESPSSWRARGSLDLGREFVVALFLDNHSVPYQGLYSRLLLHPKCVSHTSNREAVQQHHFVTRVFAHDLSQRVEFCLIKRHSRIPPCVCDDLQ